VAAMGCVVVASMIGVFVPWYRTPYADPYQRGVSPMGLFEAATLIAALFVAATFCAAG
jgi:hypothetical protein